MVESQQFTASQESVKKKKRSLTQWLRTRFVMFHALSSHSRQGSLCRLAPLEKHTFAFALTRPALSSRTATNDASGPSAVYMAHIKDHDPRQILISSYKIMKQ